MEKLGSRNYIKGMILHIAIQIKYNGSKVKLISILFQCLEKMILIKA